jgi:hypothetical protein
MSTALPARANSKKTTSRHIGNHFISRSVDAVKNPNSQAFTPINVPTPTALKNVCIGYNDGGFSYFNWGCDRVEDIYYEPG